MVELTLTNLETILIKHLCYDDFIQDHGWQDPQSSTWVDEMGYGLNGIKPNQVPGVVASLIKKGLMWSDGPGEGCGFTDLGRELIKSKELYK